VHGVSDCARSIPYSPSVAWNDVAFSSEKWIGTSERPVSQLNTQSMVSPVNASRQPSRTAAHHSGPERLARPYSAVDFHLLSFASLSWRSPLLAINCLTEGVNSGDNKPATRLTYINDIPACIQPRYPHGRNYSCDEAEETWRWRSVNGPSP